MTTFPDDRRSDFNDAFEDANNVPFDADILWRDHTGDDVLWLMFSNTPNTVATLPRVSPDWHVKAAADFDGFGDADILWQNDNGALALWQMNGTTVSAIHALPDPGPTWHVVGDDDFNLDGGDDILFQNDNGALAMWTGISAATGTVADMFAGAFEFQNPGPAWHVVGTGDTDGNGAAGILWQNDNGALVLWENAAFSLGAPGPGFQFLTVAALPSVDPSWHVKGMADLNADHRADIVFQNDNGAVAVWEMGGSDGTTILNANLINLNPGPAWHIAGLRNMDGDLKTDIVFQNDNGAAANWQGYTNLGGGMATFTTVLAITPNPNPNGHVWDLL